MQDVSDGRYPTDMKEFLYVVQDARASLERVLQDRTDAELTELRDDAGWAVKDHLLHMALWERGIRYLLLHKPLHEGMEIDERSYRELDADGQNAVVFERTRDFPLSDVLDRFRQEHDALVQQLSSMTWDDLQKPFSAYAPDEPDEMSDQPLLFWLLDEIAGHSDQHRAWIEEILRSAGDSRT